MPKKKIEKEEVIEAPVKKVSKETYYTGVGRRREAVARVKLTLSSDHSISVNGKEFEKYCTSEIARSIFLKPFSVTNTLDRFKVTILVRGSGMRGQLGAITHAISRALLKVDTEKYHLILRKNGLLTRDPRTRERRKVGRGGKARRAKQSPKR